MCDTSWSSLAHCRHHFVYFHTPAHCLHFVYNIWHPVCMLFLIPSPRDSPCPVSNWNSGAGTGANAGASRARCGCWRERGAGRVQCGCERGASMGAVQEQRASAGVTADLGRAQSAGVKREARAQARSTDAAAKRGGEQQARARNTGARAKKARTRQNVAYATKVACATKSHARERCALRAERIAHAVNRIQGVRK